VSHASHPPEGAATKGPGYEVRDAKVSAVATFMLGLFVLAFVLQVLLWVLLKLISGGTPEPPSPLEPPDVIHEQRRQLGEREEAALKDIDRAIEAIAEKGVPVYSGKPRTEADINSHAGTPVPAEKDKPAGGAKP
jgi:hypothetical protein